MMATAKFKIESGVQLLARLIKKPEIENFYPILFEGGLKHDDVVEITSYTNTSYLLIDIICEALFPSKPNVEPAGVLMFNTAGQFSYEELIKVLSKKIYSCCDRGDTVMLKTEMDEMLGKVLSNFLLLEIYDATQFYSSIHNLDNIFMKHSNISLLIFDSIAAFYWSEQGFKITKMDLYVKILIKMIQKSSKEYNVILIYTRPGYFTSSKDTDNLESYEVTDGVNFKIQMLEERKGAFQLNVKASKSYYMKHFNLIDNLIKWQ